MIVPWGGCCRSADCYGAQPDHRGHDELKPYLEVFFAAFPGRSFTPTNLIADDQHVVVEWAATAVHEGDFFGMPPSGRRLDLRGVDIFELHDRKIQEERSFYGDSHFLTILGG